MGEREVNDIRTAIARGRELEAAAVSSPWNYEAERYSAEHVIGIKPRDERWLGHFQGLMSGGANGKLTVAMRNSWTAALDVIEAAAATLERQTDYQARWAMWEIQEKLAAFAAAMSPEVGK